MAIYQIMVDGVRSSHHCEIGDYAMVVVAALVELDMNSPKDVKIWCEELLPDYGPYWYRVDRDKYGDLVVQAITKPQ